MFNILEEHVLNCPYCGESISVLLDLTSGTQEYYEDCSVCCSPIRFFLTIENDSLHLIVKRDDE